MNFGQSPPATATAASPNCTRLGRIITPAVRVAAWHIARSGNSMKYAAENVLPSGSVLRSSAIDSEDTDWAVELCLNRLARATDDEDAREIVRELLSAAAGRIRLL